MADSTKSSVCETASIVDIIKALSRLIEKHQAVCREDPVKVNMQIPTANELDSKADLLDQLLSNLLPSLRDQITDLSLSMDASRLQENPICQLRLILGNLSGLEGTMDQVQSHLALISPRPHITSPSTCGTDDHHFGALKGFRTTRLLWKIDQLTEKLCEFFQTSIDLIQSWEFAYHRASCLHNSSCLADKIRDTSRMRTALGNFIDQLSHWSRQSDFRIMRDDWHMEAFVLDDAVLTTFEIINHPAKGFNSSEQLDDQLDAPSEQVVRLAKAALPITKLTRLFLNKLSNPLANRLPLTLAHDMSSEQLELLFRTTATIPATIVNLGNCLKVADDVDHRNEFISGLAHVLAYARKYLKSSLDMLDRHLVPDPTLQIEPPWTGDSFKQWLLTFHQQFLLATQNFIEIVDSFK
ncbi:hypothetical protein Pst134EA_022548 [Puccinia striiformis f. sp. tritici]|uniref:Uncharacterized protein n=2 Tax=Puccinia striiformis TaxID=27350 RepID=A0A0L0VQM5_9BASI|nr:hypothetical protein Pst134EA_022548 [Puccinia striiformis f. sp. tritici]KAI9605711.1 hypothetical protein H4Q26_004076 [Puccinia striiformis f. sp. tritici PST-130]KNF01571.1 hypothetical protein PSTG_05349 [Puccinia striiformis f. sp. tritici PST-78]POW01302.1 hypothetical protein PSHT_12610 [Puccinia striiformis]KAH9445605.1 hypothetical protein Pst134EB_033093 [Puccinia striiformis f. sp. tritici]KAH9455072.1 hypothetical protein Pst134EA_022548 [Puccinia striiformis f. sp. tritici]